MFHDENTVRHVASLLYHLGVETRSSLHLSKDDIVRLADDVAPIASPEPASWPQFVSLASRILDEGNQGQQGVSLEPAASSSAPVEVSQIVDERAYRNIVDALLHVTTGADFASVLIRSGLCDVYRDLTTDNRYVYTPLHRFNTCKTATGSFGLAKQCSDSGIATVIDYDKAESELRFLVRELFADPSLPGMSQSLDVRTARILGCAKDQWTFRNLWLYLFPLDQIELGNSSDKVTIPPARKFGQPGMTQNYSTISASHGQPALLSISPRIPRSGDENSRFQQMLFMLEASFAADMDAFMLIATTASWGFVSATSSKAYLDIVFGDHLVRCFIFQHKGAGLMIAFGATCEYLDSELGRARFYDALSWRPQKLAERPNDNAEGYGCYATLAHLRAAATNLRPVLEFSSINRRAYSIVHTAICTLEERKCTLEGRKWDEE